MIGREADTDGSDHDATNRAPTSSTASVATTAEAGSEFDGFAVANPYDSPAGYEGLDDLVEQSDVVAVVDVVAERAGATVDVDEHGDRSDQLLLDVEIVEAVKGGDEGDLLSIWYGEVFVETRTLNITSENTRLQPGDRVLVGLVEDDRAEYADLYGFQSTSAFFIVGADERFVPLERSIPAGQEIQARPLPDVLAAARAVAT